VGIHLEVHWLLDVATGDGESVERCYTKGEDIGSRKFRYAWRREQPVISKKTMWAEFIQHLLDECRLLLKQLGDWLGERH